MFLFLSILIIIVSLFIVMVVLVQSPKGGGLTGGLGSTTSNIIGVQSAGDVMEKVTWGSAIVLLVLCVLTAFSLPKNQDPSKAKTEVEQAVANSAAAPAAPVAPQAQPQQTPAK